MAMIIKTCKHAGIYTPKVQKPMSQCTMNIPLTNLISAPASWLAHIHRHVTTVKACQQHKKEENFNTILLLKNRKLY